MDRRTFVVVAAIVATFLLVQVGALALVEPFKSAGFQATEDPSDPTNSVVYILGILVAMAVMLAAFRYGVDGLIRGLVVLAAGYITFFVFTVLVPPVVSVYGFNVAAGVLSLLVVAGLYAHPEWYVIDAAGVVMGMGAAGLFGISFGVLPALVLLSVLAVYDAISVYGTEHMLTLASGVMEMKLPIVLVVPLSLSYSYLGAGVPDAVGDEANAAGAPADSTGEGDTARPTEQTDAADPATNGGQASGPSDDADEPGSAEVPLDREALFIGLGDAVIPTVLVTSAAVFAPASVPTVDLLGIPATLPAVTAMVGTTAGLVVLLWMVLKGRAHPGLPLLNGGTIAGYLVGALASGLTLAQATGLAPYL